MYEDKYTIPDTQQDILSHQQRRDRIHVLTVDPALAADVCERIGADKRLKRCTLICPRATTVREGVEEIERTAQETVSSRLIIFDVRRLTLPKLRQTYNAIVGYNRKDFNKSCFSICIGDGPLTLFQNGQFANPFVPHLAAHRVDFHPAVFFFDPFLHYEPDEAPLQSMDDEFIIPHTIPRRLAPYFKSDDMTVPLIRQYFRAVDKDDQTRKTRRNLLRHMYKKRLAELFPGRESEYADLLTRDGIRWASEKMNLYPLYFEDWVYDLMRRARRNTNLKPPTTAT
ncbi:MAG TPA: hypothetical protein PLS24_04580 [Sedimentisphaerales bacterium]|nr:hypothetical protein [Sedimentisphaerales bacterium]HOV77279.1 hypothetical protein [Sedimentisphaerales bacterium]HQG49033.1 hypothetical protein [Sedimentisphaerales bacterium]HQI27362.1 hypothetical protein [Sedimentisphaerales bacterium]